VVSIKGLIDVLTLGSERPLRRLLAYYALLALLLYGLLYAFPVVESLLTGSRLSDLVTSPTVLQDGLAGQQPGEVPDVAVPQLGLALVTLLTMVGTLALMLPVSWVYMSARKARGHDQTIAQTLIVLPVVVAGVVLVVQNSLALAFSLAGIVAAVRFRTTLRDTRDVVFVFVAIAVGFAAGVQALTVAFIVSAVFNLVLLFTWRYDFGRNALEPTASAQWTEPLAELAHKGEDAVPDRDLALALTPEKAAGLAKRFDRVSGMLGVKNKRPKYNAILSITADDVGKARKSVEPVLEETARRWRLDAVEKNDGKPSSLYYLVRIKKASSEADLLTAVRTSANGGITDAAVEMGGASEKATAKASKGE
jgi:hypothetical protein